MVFLKNIIPIITLLFFAACAIQKPRMDASVPVPPQQPLIFISGPEEGFSSAMDAYKVGDMETAVLIVEQVVEQYPNNPWQKRSLFLLGRALMALDRASETESAMLRVSAEYPELADYAVYFLAEYLYSKTRYADAIKLYDRLLDDYPKSFWVIRSALKKAQALYESASYAQAAEAYEKFLRDYPRSDFCPEALLGLGKSLASAENLDQAAKAYRDFWIKYPESASEPEAETALTDLRALGVDVPDFTPEELYERAKNLFKANQYEKAYSTFKRVLELDPAYPQKTDALLKSGISLFHMGRRSEAASALELMLKGHPAEHHGAEGLNWLGKAYSRLGMRNEAVNTYLKILASYPESEWADDALYLIGNVYREANDVKKALKFYGQLSANYPESKYADSAYWWKAWAYYAAGEFKKAEQTLQELIVKYPLSFLVNQARYWQGRASEKRGDTSRAAAYYGIVLKKGPYTYYGYRAAERLSKIEIPELKAKTDVQLDDNSTVNEIDAGDTQDLNDAGGPPVWTEETVRALSIEHSFQKTLELMHLSMKKEAAAELWSLQERMPKRHGALLGLSKAFFELGDYYRSLMLVLRNYDRYLEGPAGNTPGDFWLLAYPQGYWDSITSYSRKYDQDPYFVAAIIREESQFHSEALSPAGARGVMQVMPSTGEWIAQNIKLSGFDRGRLFDPDTAINLGTWYISHLMKRFKGDTLLVAAAYNAGPEAVISWIEKNGNASERDVFVESIPFSETRGYVKKVLRNYSEYKRIYGKNEKNIMLTPLPLKDEVGALIQNGDVKTPVKDQ